MAILQQSIPVVGVSRGDDAQQRRVLAVACGAHALHDGYTDLIYVMLPIWQAEFALSYAALGALRMLYTGAMAGLQVPATLLARRFGAPTVLALGTALAACAYLTIGVTGAGFVLLAGALVVGGVGSATQHPLASALISRAYDGQRARGALGTYNFCRGFGEDGDPGGVGMATRADALAACVGSDWRPGACCCGRDSVVASECASAILARTAGGHRGGPAYAATRLR